MSARGRLHHLELWVPDLARAEESWGWLLETLAYQAFQRWEHGRSWRLTTDGSDAYVVVEQSPAMAGDHSRVRPGMNHVAFHGGTPAEVDALVAAAPAHGWSLLFPDRHPHAGGAGTYAAYLEDRDGFEVEVVASTDGAD